ncbi:hypothetical protein ACQR35_06735 [Pseudarthrobacter sp. J1738]|uniref:hypothetical protein n=1 Tax=Pseudarthrobacter sp. J1738 TaxID=3420446 RepID=UPI003D28280E
MKKIVIAGAMAVLTLAGCAGTPQAAPTVTETVTAMVTETATVTITATPEVGPVALAEVPTPTAAAVTKAVIPADVVGKNAEALREDLEALGFTNIVMNSDTGKTPLLYSNWTVTSIDNPGVEQLTDRAVVVHVTK